ncbi:MAG TPA: hypothetical protein DCR55_06940 [Lentisphaeria bacterium]|nr:hypothetical protein [Lentisphaeria bacterium]
MHAEFDATQWTLGDVNWAFRLLVRDQYTTTNFDELVKNLQNIPDLFGLAYAVSFGVEDEKRTLSAKYPVVSLGL